ncbi:hypothetical protein LZ30DRAFT_219651 [Colletotrichum cereale]|nr:hypothetical protein LZ30DRAFT_219651 [Colletotrichum cereale]
MISPVAQFVAPKAKPHLTSSRLFSAFGRAARLFRMLGSNSESCVFSSEAISTNLCYHRVMSFGFSVSWTFLRLIFCRKYLFCDCPCSFLPPFPRLSRPLSLPPSPLSPSLKRTDKAGALAQTGHCHGCNTYQDDHGYRMTPQVRASCLAPVSEFIFQYPLLLHPTIRSPGVGLIDHLIPKGSATPCLSAQPSPSVFQIRFACFYIDMPGQSRVNFGSWRTRTRSSEGSSRSLGGASQRSSWNNPGSISARSSRAFYRSRGRFARASRGTRGISSTVGRTRTSPIFSTSKGTHPHSPTMQTGSTSGAEHIEISEKRQHPIDGVNRLTLPASNDRLFSTPARNLPRDGSLPPVSSELRGLLVTDGHAVPQAERGNEVIVAIAIKGKSELGCAYYNSDECKLCLLQDMSFVEPLQVVETILIHVQPTVVLLPLKTPDAVVQFLEQRKSSVDQGGLVS